MCENNPLDKICLAYEMLEDDLSKYLFFLQIMNDVHETMDSTFQMIRLMAGNTPRPGTYWADIFDKIHKDNKKIILYGTGKAAGLFAKLVWNSARDFDAFCSRGAERYENGFMGKEVYDPTYVCKNADEYYILISSNAFYEEIYNSLVETGFPEDHILSFTKRHDQVTKVIEKRYFEFIQFFKQDTAFVDAGCYDCDDSIKFTNMQKGKYSKILAFEPDKRNFDICKKVSYQISIPHFELRKCGLGEKNGTSFFEANGDPSSRIIEIAESDVQKSDDLVDTVSIVSLDEVVRNEKIGFIKMDIEGAELAALKGAAQTIFRDRPLLAISVYHKKGDLLQILSYLRELVPEYRFYIRHYSISQDDTVLYAIKKDTKK